MAQWKETLEPYIKVNERIKTTTIVPTAGEDLIIGATLISDSGPSYPVLITSQREFLNVFASQEITKGYLESLDEFYDDGTGTKSTVASTMWLNAYRLAGSTNMLIVRATKGADMNYVVPVGNGDGGVYIVRDGQLLKKVPSFCLGIDRLGANTEPKEAGWAISVNEIGIIGNLIADDRPAYEYFASNLRELVEYLNSTSKFFSPKYSFKKYVNNKFVDLDSDDSRDPDVVVFSEVYLAQHFLDPTGFNNFSNLEERDYGSKGDGLAYLLALNERMLTEGLVGGNGGLTPPGPPFHAPRGSARNPNPSSIIELNSSEYSGWESNGNKYIINTYNSNSDIRIRIRRFNHDAVVLREDLKPTINEQDPSPYDVLTDVIGLYESHTDPLTIKRIEERDFYEVAVLDPSLDKDPLSFCVGNIPGRGDLTLDELNNTLKMINLHINNMKDLELSYYRPDYTAAAGSPSVVIPGTGGTVWTPLDPTNEDDSTRISSAINSGELSIYDESELGQLGAGLGFGSLVGVIPSGSSAARQPAYVPVAVNPQNSEIVVDNDEIDLQEGRIFEQPTGENSNVLQPNEEISINKANLVKKDEDDNRSLNREATSVINGFTVGNFASVSNEGRNYIAIKGYDINYDGTDDTIIVYKLGRAAGDGQNQIYRELGIVNDPSSQNGTAILTVTPDDLMRSISAITEDEVYTTEGLTDLGNTDLKFQNYLCNMAKNENYFYPISTLYSTNYLAIANYRTRLAQDSYKLYTSAPWDIDSGTVGFKFHACPSVIYWEAVSRNRSMNREFASVFGFSSNGQVLYTNPVTEFTKKQRQLLLSKQVNTVMWNTQNQTWNMNDCYTMTSENHILNEDGNSRLFIRINKAIPTLLRPLIGRKLNNATYADAETILKYWFERTILTMQYSVSDYKVTIANLEANDDQARRQNKMYVLVECLFARSMKYVIVYSDALDMGMEFTGEIV